MTRWSVHVQRRPVEAPVSRVDAPKASRKRGLGRLRKTWCEADKYDMSYRGLIEDRAMIDNVVEPT